MGCFKDELKNIVDNVLFTFHGDLSETDFLIRHGLEKLVISGTELLKMCSDEVEFSLDQFLSSCHNLPISSPIILIGEIRLMDSIYNKLGSFSIKEQSEHRKLLSRYFYRNLQMIDGDMPILLENMVDIVVTLGIHRCSEILEVLIKSNPLHLAKGWEETSYRYKLGRLLYNFALGMTEDTTWNGRVPKGGILCCNGTSYEGFGFYDQASIGNYLIDSTELSMVPEAARIVTIFTYRL